MEFSKNEENEKLDLKAFALLMQTFNNEEKSIGFKKAAVKHYSRFSKLMGKLFLVEEFHLNVQGYNFLLDNNLEKALDYFELAIHYYPESVDTYDSYAEALLAANKK